MKQPFKNVSGDLLKAFGVPNYKEPNGDSAPDKQEEWLRDFYITSATGSRYIPESMFEGFHSHIRSLIATVRKEERERAVNIVDDMPVSLVDVRMNPDECPDYRHAVLTEVLIARIKREDVK